MRASCRFSSPDSALPWPPTSVYKTIRSVTLSSVFNFRTWMSWPNLYLKISREYVFTVFTFLNLCLFCTCDFITLLCYISKRNLFGPNKIKRDFLHGRKNFAKELRDKQLACENIRFARNVPSGEERGERDVFAGYDKHCACSHLQTFYAHHKIYLHTTKIVTILIASFHDLR